MIMKTQIEKIIEVYPVLTAVDRKIVTKALNKAELVTIKAGSLIFEERQPCNLFPFILSGNIRVYKQSVHGRELLLYNVTPGDVCIVTAGCLLGHEAYNASGRAITDSTLLMITSHDFDDLLAAKVFREFIFLPMLLCSFPSVFC